MASTHGRRPGAADSTGRRGEYGNYGEYRVLTPERVTLQYDIAGIGSRSAAAIVDVAIQVVTLLGLAVLFFSLVTPLTRLTGSGTAAAAGDATPWLGYALLAGFVLLLVLALWGYYLLFEMVWNGQTPGKRLLGLRVIRENGYPVRPTDATIRNLVRMVDGPPLLPVVGLVVMLLNERAKRLGDFAAGTIVVREGARRSVTSLSAPPPDGEASARTPRLSPADATLVRDFLVRRAQMAPAARAHLASRLATALASRYGIQAQREALADEAFLEGLGT
ncbi:MAG: RDD family protein [Chloroflexota bacterium]